jgi:hypothetical protein
MSELADAQDLKLHGDILQVQIPLHLSLSYFIYQVELTQRGGGGIGRRTGLKIAWRYLTGSNPTPSFLVIFYISGRINPTGRWRNWQTQRT